MVKEFTIVLKANSNFKDKQNIRLKIDFEPIYQITYSGFNNTNGYIKEIIKGENYLQNLGSDVEEVLATMNNVSTKDYVLNNGKLEIKNVDGNILIENTTPNAPVLNGDMIPVYYEATSNTDGVWKKADINNVDNNWYDYKTQKWANAVTVVEESVKDLSGNNYNGVVHGAKVENGEAYFDGVDDYVEAGYANYDFKDSISIKVKFKVHKFLENQQNIIGNQETAGIYLGIMTTKNLIFGIYNGTKYQNFIPNYTFELDKFYEVTAIFYQNRMSVYINDDSGLHTFTNELSSNINIQVSPMPFALGVNLDSNSMQQQANISIIQASVYDREISTSEVENNEIKKDKLLFEYDFAQMMNRSDYVKAGKDLIIPMRNINTMWVWIPRYSYTIKKETDSSDYYGKQELGRTTTPTQELPGEIDIKFINNLITETGTAQYTGNMITNYRTNEAFNFDDINNHGMWIGKFETTGRLEKNSDACINENCNVTNVTVKPSFKSLVSQKISSFFYMTRSMQNDVNTFGFDMTKGNLHVIKGAEWGAVAYLSQSRYGKYGNSDYIGANKEIYVNKSTNLTGKSNGTPSQDATTSVQYEYNYITNKEHGTGPGPGASTTGTIYGIYDMSGGAFETVMGVLADENGEPISGIDETKNSGFNGTLIGTSPTTKKTDGLDFPNKKYYNLYKSPNPDSNVISNAQNACENKPCYGHALYETKSWYKDKTTFINNKTPWLNRGGSYTAVSTNNGIFYMIADNFGGQSSGAYTTRISLSI